MIKVHFLFLQKRIRWFSENSPWPPDHQSQTKNGPCHDNWSPLFENKEVWISCIYVFDSGGLGVTSGPFCRGGTQGGTLGGTLRGTLGDTQGDTQGSIEGSNQGSTLGN